MSRLTEQVRFKDIKGDVVGHLNSNGFEYFVKQDISQQLVVNKLGQLEDVLEEFGIESAEELRERLAKAIVPKFTIGQEVFGQGWDGQLRKGRIYEIQTNQINYDKYPLITYLVDYYGNYSDDELDDDYFEEKDIFTTEAEAQAKLDEIRRK